MEQTAFMPRYPNFIHIIVFMLSLSLLFMPAASAGEGGPAVKALTRQGTVLFLLLALVPYFIRLIGLMKKGEGIDKSEGKGGSEGAGLKGSSVDKAKEIILELNDRIFKPYHAIFGAVGFLLAIIHGLLVDECNIFNQLGMVVYGFFIGTGAALYLKVLPPENRKRARLLHTHHVMVWLLLVLIVFGHLVGD